MHLYVCSLAEYRLQLHHWFQMNHQIREKEKIKSHQKSVDGKKKIYVGNQRKEKTLTARVVESILKAYLFQSIDHNLPLIISFFSEKEKKKSSVMNEVGNEIGGNR